MKLILSDKSLDIEVNDCADIRFIDLSSLKIAGCIGCFGCWTKTPGKCVIRDDAVKVYPYIAQSDAVIYVSRVCYGSYDTTMKNMFERTLPAQQAFIRLLDGETHHVQRDVAPKNATVIGYGQISDEEKIVFKELVERNARNMNFKQYKVVFAHEDDLEKNVEKEIAQWER